MLFNSYTFILAFLPLTAAVYFFLTRRKRVAAAKCWLVLASLVFYGWWNVVYVPLIIGSILFNYMVGARLGSLGKSVGGYTKGIYLCGGITANLLLLGYFKYADFFLHNVGLLTGRMPGMLNVVLPLGISFFTFTQIAYLVDACRGETKEYSLLNYSLFVTFFPHLLAGPILHHKEMMPQFDRLRNAVINHKHLAEGLFLFFIGLFKKVVIADTLSPLVHYGFDAARTLSFLEAWGVSLSYTFQLYFDFSGYTDMALGAALLFNIRLPLNFNSPYKARGIQDFWKRWHITLGRFLRDYIYIPLGGSRDGRHKTLFNLMVTFVLGGIWHGAGWTFVFWGFLHGAALVLHRIWKGFRITVPGWLSWLVTFNFINVAWVFFRAKTWDDATGIIFAMFGGAPLVLPPKLNSGMIFLRDYGVRFDKLFSDLSGSGRSLKMLLLAAVIVFLLKNSTVFMMSLRPTWKHGVAASILVVTGMLFIHKTSEFLYFQF